VSRRSVENVPLQGDHITLGRSSTTELCFPEDAGLSRQHMAFEREGDEWNVRDLGSKNGTLLNNNRLNGAVRLRSGDRIAAGHLVMLYDVQGRTEPTADVTFVQLGSEGDNPTSSTVVTDLKGLLGGKTLETGAVQMSALIKAATN
jgi:pSer/pThr/pTyr-binding forkhead associated (FHA) protein